ncbi:Putative aminoacrylate peracid reductase RutC [bacterium HR33]|nr:Putative aminoacrylate peracid reductase RutC [bacterium HR33]
MLEPTLAGLLLAAAASAPAQDAEFHYFRNITATVQQGQMPQSIEGQTRLALEHLGRELQSRNLDYRHVVSVNVFLKDARHFQGMNEVYRTFFTEAQPARATVEADLPDPEALIQLSAVAAAAPKEIVRPRSLAAPALPYSWGVKVGNTLFLAGVTSRDPNTYEPVTGDAGTQTRRIMQNIGLILAEAGMSYRNLATCRVFLDDPRDFGAMNQAYAEFVPADAPPARATVRASLMNPAFKVEIQCVADASAERRVVIAEGRQRSRAPLSPGIATADRLYLSGMVGGGSSDVAEQTRTVLSNLEATLKAASLDFSRVVDTWIYLADIRHWNAVKEQLDRILPPGAAAGTVIGTPLMGANLMVEIEMVARR